MTGRRMAAIAGAGVGALVVICGIAWFVIADHFRTGIDRWVAERRAEGWTVGHGEIAITGFPLGWRAHIRAPSLTQSVRRPAFLWSGPWLDLSWRPWRSAIVDVKSGGTHRIGLGTASLARTTLLRMAVGGGRLTFGTHGHLERLAIQIDDAAIGVPQGGAVRVNRVTSTIDADPASSKDESVEAHLRPAFRIDTRLFGLTLPEGSRPALGRTIGKVAVRGTVLGRPPPGTVREALAAWRDGGGTLEIETLDLGWAALVIQATGTMALDRALQPVGALTARISGYSETMDRLVATGAVKPSEALLAKFALGAFARTPDKGGPPEVNVPISLQDGWLYVGPVKLLPLPPVRWN